MCGPTTDHAEIRRWAEGHGATPCEVMPRLFDGEPALLRFVFRWTAEMAPELRPIDWESFFATFDLLGLSLVYDDDHQYELLQAEHKSAYKFDGNPT